MSMAKCASAVTCKSVCYLNVELLICFSIIPFLQSLNAFINQARYYVTELSLLTLLFMKEKQLNDILNPICAE